MSGRRMAVTMGDAAGVGPEIAVRRFAEGLLGSDVVVYGDAAVLTSAAAVLGLDVRMRLVREPDEAADGALNVRDLRLRWPMWTAPRVTRWRARSRAS